MRTLKRIKMINGNIAKDEKGLFVGLSICGYVRCRGFRPIQLEDHELEIDGIIVRKGSPLEKVLKTKVGDIVKISTDAYQDSENSFSKAKYFC